jgi:hypothetical protein
VPGELRFHVRPRLSDAALVLAFDGWNDAGESATMAVRFLAEALAPAPLAEIDPEEFLDFTVRRPRVEGADGARRIVWPGYALRYGSIDAARQLVVGLGPEPHLRWRRFSDLLVELASQLGVRRVLLLGAYLADVLYSRPVAVTGFAVPPERADGLGVARSSYEGPTGIVGVLADAFAGAGLEVVSLWAALPHYISAQPNPRGALALLQAAQPALDLKLDLAPLERAAEDFERRISELVSTDPELAEYVRQLKRREFEGEATAES